MNLSSIIGFCAAALTAVSASSSINENVLHPRFHGRFLQEKEAVEVELAQWEASEYGTASQEFMPTSGKVFHEGATTLTHEEKLVRFFATKMVAEEMNALNPEATFATTTPFALMTDSEFAAFVGKGYNQNVMNEVGFLDAPEPPKTFNLREEESSKDWTTSGCVAPVKSQGKCGSCWAFGGIASIESFHCIRTGKLVTLSEQELTSCDRRSSGCDGGWGENVVRYVAQKGVCTEADYPYTSGTTKETGKCLVDQMNCEKVDTGVRSYYRVRRGNDNDMKYWLKYQPVSVSLAAGNPAWRTYKSGVVESCPTRKVDHVVLAVGYGNHNGTDHYKIKNSWGATWGMDGYVLLKRNTGSSGTCEVLSSPFFPY